MRWLHIFDEAIVDPEANEATNLPAQLVETNESASNSRWCNFCVVNWTEIRGTANAHAGKDSSTIEKTKASFGIDAKHKTGAEDKESREDSKTPLSSEEMTSRISEEGTEEC